MCGSSEEKIGAKRKGKLAWTGGATAMTKTKFGESVSVSISQPTSVSHEHPEQYGAPSFFARAHCISFTTPSPSTSPRGFLQVVTCWQLRTSTRSGAQPLGRSLHLHHPSSPIASPPGPGSCRRSRQPYRHIHLILQRRAHSALFPTVVGACALTS